MHKRAFLSLLSYCCAAILLLAPAWSDEGHQKKIEETLNGPNIVDPTSHKKVSIHQLMENNKIKGLSVVVVKNYEVVYRQAFGVVSGAAGAAKVTPDTLFQAGSMSKPMAGYGMLTLVQQGKAELDKPINDQLGPEWKLPDPKGYTKNNHPATLRMLMMHTAGTTVHGFSPAHEVGQKLANMVELLDGKKPAVTAAVVIERVPGTEWAYSGGGIEVMQLLMEEKSHERFAEYMKHAVLEPLGMRRSTFEQPLPKEFWSDAAGGSSLTITPPWHVYNPEEAAAGLWTTPSDYAKFVIALAHEGGPNYPLDKKWTHAMITGTSKPIAGETSKSVSWGLAVQAGDCEEKGVIKFCHDGNNTGFTDAMEGYTNGDGTVIMSNQTSVNNALHAIQDAIHVALKFPKGPAPY